MKTRWELFIDFLLYLGIIAMVLIFLSEVTA